MLSRIIHSTIIFHLIVTGSATAAQQASPDSAKSAEAVQAFQADLAVNPTFTTEIASKAYANVPLTKTDAATVRELLWKAHLARFARERASELRDKVLEDGKLKMPFFAKTFGTKPKNGHSLWISLHGGGNATQKVNDKQGENQKRLYTLDEGVYVAPRAPTNTWNLWHEPHIDRLFGRLIEDMIALEGIDPDRVYVMGYSAGGDGVYQIAPRMADRWAAAGMMAGHPNDASPLGFRNLAFALQVGALDKAYNRNKVAAEWGEKLAQFRKDDPDGYLHYVKIHEGKPHWMGGQDAAALPWMAEQRRNSTPDRVVWKQAGTTHDHFYWLGVPPGEAKAGALVIAERSGQLIDLKTAEKVTKLLVRLDARLADLDKPVRITHGGKVLFEGLPPRTLATMGRTLAGRGDPKLMFEAEVTVEVPKTLER